jgi:hypothetical protein
MKTPNPTDARAHIGAKCSVCDRDATCWTEPEEDPTGRGIRWTVRPQRVTARGRERWICTHCQKIAKAKAA